MPSLNSQTISISHQSPLASLRDVAPFRGFVKQNAIFNVKILTRILLNIMLDWVLSSCGNKRFIQFQMPIPVRFENWPSNFRFGVSMQSVVSVRSGLRHPGESPAPVQWPPDSDTCLLHRRLLPHPRGGAHHSHVYLLRQGTEMQMRSRLGGREGGRKRTDRESQKSPPGGFRKLPRLNGPSLSIRGRMIEYVRSMKLKDLHQ